MLNSQSTKLSTINHTTDEESLFQSLLEISDEAVFVIDKTEFNVIDCNSAAIKLFEASTKVELVKKPLFKLYNIQPLNSTIAKLNSELEATGKYSQEFSFKTTKQNVFWGKLSQRNIGFANSEYSIVKIAKSANYLREEEWLQEVLKITSKVTGRQFFKELTRFLCRTFNAENAFIARRFADDPDRLKIFYWQGNKVQHNFISIKNSFIENTLNGVTSYYPEVLGELFPGDELIKETKANSFMGTPIFDPSGQSFGVIGVLSSQSMEELPNSRYMLSILSSKAASELHRLSSKELLRQQTRELAEANITKDKLLSVITSDLHAPLSTIIDFAEIIKRNLEDYTAAQLSGKLTVMDTTLRNLQVFLENLSDWNKLLQKNVQPQLKVQPLLGVINSTLGDYKYLTDLKQISLMVNVVEGCSALIDEKLCAVALRNVATYALKNTMKGSTVTYACTLEGDKKILVLKTDNFTSEVKDVKFCLEASISELYNAPRDSSVPVLGLFIAREFMKLQGGSLNYRINDNQLEFLFSFDNQ